MLHTTHRQLDEIYREPTNAPLTLDDLAEWYLEDYCLHGYRSIGQARRRVALLRKTFGGIPVSSITTARIREFQIARRQQGLSAATVNHDTKALARMFHLAIRLDRLRTMPHFPKRLVENPPRQGFFEHHDYLNVRRHLPASYRDVLDFAYYSGWRRREITELTWEEVDLPGGVIRLSPLRSKTRVGRVLPLSSPLKEVLERRNEQRQSPDRLVFKRGALSQRAWQSSWRDACRKAGVPNRFLHDCRRTAARNLIRAGVPERVAMLFTGHKTRAIFDRYNIVDERELTAAGDRLADYIGQIALRAG
jgi:integrase